MHRRERGFWRTTLESKLANKREETEIEENTPISTKCSQKHLLPNHGDSKLTIVKYNLRSF